MQTEVMQAGKIQGKRGISSAVLKNIAVVTMLIDHIGAVIMTRLLIRNGLYEAMVNQEAYTAWMGQNGGMYGICMAMLIDHTSAVILEQIPGLEAPAFFMRIIGRAAFPIYCFLLVEGFQKTHNVKKYLGRMFLFALISEVPFDLAFSGKAWYPAYQNVFFTLLLGLLVIAGLHLVEQHFAGTTVGKTILRVGLNAVIILTGCVLALVLKTDYDFKGILAITVLYLFRNRKKAQMWAGVIIFLLMDSLEMFAALSFILIWFYNGTRGRQNKYFFYFFYPAHLLLLWLVCVAMGIAGIPAI